jgi:N-acetyl-anhydromuramyl-L-alanine amidase AmpD
MTIQSAEQGETRPLFDSDYLFGCHEPGGEEYMLIAEKPGWIVFSETVGRDPDDHSGLDFSTFSKQGIGVICRINHGHEPHGTIPHSSLYEAFAQRVANFVRVSAGCKIWVIGNEMNYVVERPGIVIDWSRHQIRRSGPPEVADPLGRSLPVRFNVLPDHSTEIRTTRGAIVSPGESITPQLYARCYRLCRDAIHRLPGHEDDLVLVGAVAPWNTQTVYPENPNGDWVLYFRHILDELGPANCDGYALHAYTHGANTEQIASPAKLPPPFQSHHGGFRVFIDFLTAAPPSMRHLPAFITEIDQTQPWLDANVGWVQKAYAEIDAWNKAQSQLNSPQRVRCAALFRWPAIDRWYIEGKNGVIEDFCQALDHDYRWSIPVTGAQAANNEETQGETQPTVDAQPPAATRRPPAPPPSYKVEWLADHFPERILAGQVIKATLTLHNAGSLAWRRSGGNPVRLGYRYYRSRRQLDIPLDRDIRTDLPHDVEPGETVTIEARIALPDDPGNYTIELDLTHEGITWFKEQKSPPLSRWLTVETPERAEGQEGASRNLPVPLFRDVTASLPRSESPYARRALSQIKYLVISHTAAHPRVSLERIAHAHIAAGYPGIAYDFVVDGAGQVFRVSELESVAQPDQVWSEQGVNIALAGNFSATMPSLGQIDAVGRLCAWLAQSLGLGPEAILGLGELTHSHNPGALFLTGPAWKQMIIRQVQLHLAALGMGAADNERIVNALAAAQALEEKNRALEAEMLALRQEYEATQAARERIQAELEETQRQLQAYSEPGSLRIQLVNMVNQLPRQSSRYQRRWPEDVYTIVINHTGAAPETPLATLAEMHRREWPGLLYDFCISADGVIYQTQPLEEVVASSEPYLVNAINIALAGNFDQMRPPRTQLAATGRLISWLMDRFPRLGIENIKGLCELSASQSPGRQWNQGLRWRDALLDVVRREVGLQESHEAETGLRAQITQLEEQVEHARRTASSLQEVRVRLEAENRQMQAELAARTQPAESYVVPQPGLKSIVEQLPRHPTLRYERRARSQITHIAVHHTAAPPSLGPTRIAELHIQADPTRGKEAWPGIGYHYFVHADGVIEQTNHLETASFHVYRHNLYTVGVVFAGSFMNGRIPTSAQLRSGAHLIAWLMQEFKIPLARVWGHREFPDNITVCPGSEWTQGNRWRDLIFERVEQVKKGVGVKSMRHYLLLWQRAYPGSSAEQELLGAMSYITRFRPTVGFSSQDARNAEFVTIIGGEAGVGSDIERMLEEHGCRVERVSGRTDEETSVLLTDMARQGRRFMRFQVDF